MNILALSDTEVRHLYDFYNPRKTEGTDLIISCGDLSAKYLEFLTTVVNKPLLYVNGNHDTHYHEHAPEGCISIEDRIYEFKGYRIAGLGGSYKYKGLGKPYMYTEKQMEQRIRRLHRWIRAYGGIDILVTHAPAEGFGDMDDLPHWGFDGFNDLLRECRPKMMLYGHVHKEYGEFQREMIHDSGTRLINCYGSIMIPVEDREPPQRTPLEERRIRLLKWADGKEY